jgi:hypothetical protein
MEWRVMPFGLCNASATFQQCLDVCLGDLLWSICLVYIDDIVTYSATFKDHLKHVRTVLDRLGTFGLKIAPKKCQFLRQSIEFLGHEVDRDGIHMTSKRQGEIEEMPYPATPKLLYSFLCSCAYYRRFIKQFSKRADPLRKVIMDAPKKTAPLAWTDELKAIFDELRHSLCSAEVLLPARFDRPFIITTDACDLGLGALLEQADDEEHLRPITYASRTLSKTERNYPTVKLESLAIYWAAKYYKEYVYQMPVMFFTDHMPAVRVLTRTDAVAPYATWFAEVTAICNVIFIRHRPGATNFMADMLSRLPTQEGYKGVGSKEAMKGKIPQLLAVGDWFGLQTQSTLRQRFVNVSTTYPPWCPGNHVSGQATSSRSV